MMVICKFIGTMLALNSLRLHCATAVAQQCVLGADTLRGGRGHILVVSFTVMGGGQQDSATHVIHLIVEEVLYQQNTRCNASAEQEL